MTTHQKHFFIGLFTGLIAPLIFFYFYTQLVLKSDIAPAIERLIDKNLVTQITTLSVVVANVLVYFVFNRRGEFDKIKGMIGATLIYALAIVFWEVFM